MKKYDYIMVRFGELSTKGKNKKDFIFRLADNIKNALRDYKDVTMEVKMDHIYIRLNDENPQKILDTLKDISGIYSFSSVMKVEKDIEAIKKMALELAKEEDKKTFKVKAKRADKNFPIISDDINRQVAGYILSNSDYKVDVHNPDVLISITVRERCAYIYVNAIKGAGGYPLGVGGKVMMMLSGGIDSPVAAYLMMKRGVAIECIHYASPPYTSEAVIEKLKDILTKLNKFQAKIKLHIIPFTKLQEEIYAKSNESYAITIMRRMMYRIAEKVARRNKCQAIANGESIGQVASQTLASMNVINQVTNFPIIRPLATYDKVDIISIAQKIDTYEISIRPFEDCCTIFAPKNPKTAPHLDEVEKFESLFDYEELIDQCVENDEVIVISKSQAFEKFL